MSKKRKSSRCLAAMIAGLFALMEIILPVSDIPAYAASPKNGDSWTFNYTGGMQSFTSAVKSIYKFEVYGAQGGGSLGGQGGYSHGYVILGSGQTVYVGVGGTNGFNGGGSGSAPGGGGTHIGKTNSTISGTSSSNLFLVAGGGGGGEYNWGAGNGGAGGGTSGYNGNGGGNPGNSDSGVGRGGTQSSGGVGSWA